MSARAHESLVAARNAVTLGASLAVTSALGLALRLAIPRLLGPNAFGEYRVAEASAELLLVLLTFGVDAQLRMEAAIDATRARAAVGGLTLLRVGAGIVLTLVLLGTLVLGHANPQIQALFLLMAALQLLSSISNTYTAIEHAAGDVRWVARLNSMAKLLSTGLTIAVLVVVPSATLAVLVAIGIEVLRLAWLATRTLRGHERPAFDLRHALAVVRSSSPLFLNLVTHSFYARVGVAWLAARGSSADVGLVGAAGNLAAIALLAMPLVSWVIVPSAARAGARSDEEVDHLIANTLRVVLLAAVPTALVLALAAKPILALCFGGAFVDAAPALRILAPTCALAYVSTICAISLMQRGRIWTVTGVSLGGAMVTLLLNALFFSDRARAMGLTPATAAALATLTTEICVTAALAFAARRPLRDAGLMRTAAALVASSAVACAIYSGIPHDTHALIASLAGFVGTMLLCGGISTVDVEAGRRVIASVISPRAVATTAVVMLALAMPRPSAAQTPAVQQGFVVGIDDVIEISYWREKDLSAEVTVRPDGRISLPLIGELPAAGLTPAELTDRVKDLARDVLESPEVTITVKQVNSLRVTIAGEVAKPGRYTITTQTTIVELIALAGGFTEFAHPGKVGVLRTVNGSQTSLKVDYRKIATLKNLRDNITLRAGDIVVVP